MPPISLRAMLCVLTLALSLCGCEPKEVKGCLKEHKLEDCRMLCSGKHNAACATLQRELVKACTRRGDVAACEEVCVKGKPRVACDTLRKLKDSK